MNCLWLLLLLACYGGNNMQGDCGCNNNNGCNNNGGCGRDDNRGGRDNDRDRGRGRDRDDDDCDRDRDRDCGCGRGPEARPFTPFSDTCGCEEKPVS